MSNLTRKQALFVEEYLCDLNATQAAIRAGYSARTADRQGHRLLRNAEVEAAVEAAMGARLENSQLSAAWTLDQLREVVERCMEARPILDRAGKPTGVYHFNSTGACRALELIGRHLGMFTDRLQIDPIRNMSDEELEAELRALDEKLGYVRIRNPH